MGNTDNRSVILPKSASTIVLVVVGSEGSGLGARKTMKGLEEKEAYLYELRMP